MTIEVSMKDTLEFGKILTSSTDNLPLGLRLRDTGEAAKEELRSVNDREIDAKVLVQGFFNLLAFVQTHQACQEHQHGIRS